MATKGDRPSASEDPLKHTAGEVMTSTEILRVCRHLMEANNTAADRNLSLNNWLLSTCGRSDDGRLVFQADFCPPRLIKSIGMHVHTFLACICGGMDLCCVVWLTLMLPAVSLTLLISQPHGTPMIYNQGGTQRMLLRHKEAWTSGMLGSDAPCICIYRHAGCFNVLKSVSYFMLIKHIQISANWCHSVHCLTFS